MILVTGASGMLGKKLVQRLAKNGVSIKALFHHSQPDKEMLALPNVQWQTCDLLDVYAIEELLVGVEKIYHCAAMVSFLPEDRQLMMHFNVESTANLVNEALVQGVSKFLQVSSIASLGRSEGKGQIHEESEWEDSHHNSIYSQSKYLAEMEVWRGIAEGLNAVIVNPSVILGEGDWRKGSAKLMDVVYREFPFYTKGINGWVDVQDVVTAMVMLMESEVVNERFIVSNGNYPYREIFTKMANALGKKPPHIEAGTFLSGMVWRWNAIRHKVWGTSISVTKETAQTAQSQHFYDNSKLLKTLPAFSYTLLEETIARMAKQYLADKRTAMEK